MEIFTALNFTSIVVYFITLCLLILSFSIRFRYNNLAEWVFARREFFYNRSIENEDLNVLCKKIKEKYYYNPQFDLEMFLSDSVLLKEYMKQNGGIILAQREHNGIINIISSLCDAFSLICILLIGINLYNSNWMFAILGVPFLVRLFVSNLSNWFPTNNDDKNFKRAMLNFQHSPLYTEFHRINTMLSPFILEYALAHYYRVASLLGISYADFINTGGDVTKVPETDAFYTFINEDIKNLCHRKTDR